MRARRLVALLLGVAPLAASCASPGATPSPGTSDLKVLFVGNSLTYSNGLPQMVTQLVSESGRSITVASSAFPNYGLQDHWNDRRTRRAIRSGGWTHVVFQQGPSATQGRPSLLEYARRFAAEVTAAGARPAFYMVWPSVHRSFDFDGVAESYAMAAEATGGLLFPAGEAWQAVWRSDPEAELYAADGFHPSALGSYVAALTIADRLLGGELSPSYRVATPEGEVALGPEHGERLLGAVREANGGR